MGKAEFISSLGSEIMYGKLSGVGISVKDAVDLFDLLDYDKAGIVPQTDFVEGCLRSRGHARAKDLLYLSCDIRHYGNKVQSMWEGYIGKFAKRGGLPQYIRILAAKLDRIEATTRARVE